MEPTYNSRTYGYSIAAPETLTDPISRALTNAVPLSPSRTTTTTDRSTLSITDGSENKTQQQQQQKNSNNNNNNNQVAVVAAPPTRSIEIIGGRSRFVDDEDVDTIAYHWLDAEKDPSDVKNIDLSLNKISSRGFLTLVKAIGERPGQLRDLDVDSNNLNDAALKAVITHLINNDAVQIERYDLSTNKFTDLAVVEFFQAIHARVREGKKVPLRTLLLRQCDLTNTSLRAICDLLKDPICPITSLHISGNDFTELDGIKWIAEVVATNTSLIDFNISNSFDYVARWEPIVDALTNSNQTLRQFNIAIAGKKPEALVPCDAILKKNRIRALSQESEIERISKLHKQEIGNLNAAHKRREQELESKIFELMAELEKIRGRPQNNDNGSSGSKRTSYSNSVNPAGGKPQVEEEEL